MKLKARDTIRISSAGGRKEKGEEFEINETEGAELVKRGLADKIVARAKRARPPANKARAKAPANKSAS